MNKFRGLPNEFALSVFNHKTAHTLADGTKETWDQCAYRVTKHVMRAVGVTMRDVLAQNIHKAISQMKMVPGGRYLYAAGRPYHQVNNCMLLRASDSREGWSKILHDSCMALSSGAGIGVDYSDVRPEGSPIRKTGGLATGPSALMQMVNECGRFIQQGGSRRSAIWAGLRWDHADCHSFIRLKDWSEVVRQEKFKNFNFPATMDGTNVSVLLNDEFFVAYHNVEHPKHSLARSIYWETVKRMLKTSEPGFSVDIKENAGETLRNACTELTSRDNNDVCNLASINMARIESLEDFNQVMNCTLAFQIAGTVYSDVPYSEVDLIRTKNRRLGLGLMGLAEWLLIRGKKYGPDAELQKYLELYATSTDVARKFCDQWSLSPSVKTRAIAPTGTISIYAGTTSGIEPIFCVAYKRRFLKHKTWHYQYVVDPAAKRLIDNGVHPDSIEDAYDLARDVERRIAFQAWVQQYVDHGISSTINLPSWGSELNNEQTVQSFGDTLIKYLPGLRGVTAYADGSRGGQPLTPVKYTTAIKHLGEEMVEEGTDVCDLTGRGTCG